ncbi:protein tyrosine phosphatase, putative (PTP1) [Plasmodium ovale wallikeri]|uniref:protein-tyrosine-phosphatase n=2 Tax=Plasmodium ovale TaxID=36330 RepID=A0A1A8ZGS1_PLAOA|nr:protein tyrosine phosphatase, putative (PTP1) [Plasmodium ovale wallikeri]SBT43218.1 protein tyrosine phosphatase, putative (PTP1) [Plasmodium ovale wallikeri]SBT78384.1 protein tyrosine phosphatase, putative [Plasmodium ovale]
MIEILPFLYLGKRNDIDNVENLEKHKIKALVICCTYFEYPQNKVPNGYAHLRINLEDTGVEKISSYFDESNNFIHSYISKKQAVLILCSHGISRSSTISLAYLMGKQNYYLNEAFSFIMQKKNIYPNIGFIEQLCKYEKSVKNKSSFSAKKYINWYTSDMCGNNTIVDFSLELEK